MQGLNDQDSIINSLQMCVPTASEEQEFIDKIRKSYNSSEPNKLDPKNLNIADIIKSIKNEANFPVVEHFDTMKLEPSPTDKKYVYV